MSRPDFRRGYLRIPLPVWLTVFCRPLLTRRQFQLVSVVIRESWGWQSASGEPHIWTKPLTSRDFANATGLSTDHLRRDLLGLLKRGVLREADGRYQFISDPCLWKTLPPPPPPPRPEPPERPSPPANPAAWASGLKKGKTSKDSDPASLTEGSGPVENSPSSFASLAPPPDRLADVVAAFVGSLTSGQADALRRWICEEGIARVWESLEPAFRSGPLVARQTFLEALARQATPVDADPAAPGEETHA